MRRRARFLLAWRGMPWVSGTFALLIGALAVYFFAGSASPAASFDTGAFPAITVADISMGSQKAEAVFVEYADFECAACATYAPKLAELRARYQDRVLFVFRFYPLANHPNGVVSSQAGYAAYLQDRFWEMHDVLYENQKEWVESEDPVPLFEGYAEDLGLDLDNFRKDMEADDTVALISKQKEEGTAAGVNHTPFFIVDGSAVPSDDYDALEAVIEAALQ